MDLWVEATSFLYTMKDRMMMGGHVLLLLVVKDFDCEKHVKCVHVKNSLMRTHHRDDDKSLHRIQAIIIATFRQVL
jgi:hypothetical protein